MNISLPDEMKAFVDEQASSGEYAGASDYIRDLIRRRQRYQRGLARLQELVDEALESGIAEGTPSEIIERVIARGQERARKAG